MLLLSRYFYISSTISKNAVEELELAVGKEAYAVIKATSVMVGIE